MLQTTYENFRYRYDKRENPYTKGVLKNFGDVYCTKIPPSLMNFRLWVLEEGLQVESMDPNDGIDIIYPKEKGDLEMATKAGLAGNDQIPKILQNLDYSAIDDNLKVPDRVEDEEVTPFAFPFIQEPSVYIQRDSNQCCAVSDGRVVAENDG